MMVRLHTWIQQICSSFMSKIAHWLLVLSKKNIRYIRLLLLFLCWYDQFCLQVDQSRVYFNSFAHVSFFFFSVWTFLLVIIMCWRKNIKSMVDPIIYWIGTLIELKELKSTRIFLGFLPDFTLAWEWETSYALNHKFYLPFPNFTLAK